VVGVTVTDDSVLEMIDKREQAARLPAMVYLENEVRELADAHVYLDPHHDKADLAVDLLLGTQGWRRFALVEWQKFVEQHQDAARRALALLQPGSPPEFSDDRIDRFLFFAAPADGPAPRGLGGARAHVGAKFDNGLQRARLPQSQKAGNDKEVKQ